MKNISIFLIALLVLAGCTNTPQRQHKKVVIKVGEPPSSTQKKKTPTGVKTTPYEQKEIKRQNAPVVVPEQKAPPQKFNDGSKLPAFRTLMQKTQTAYKKQQLSEAERYAQQAQRIAPQASETYLYMALIADQRKQYANAEALARRGLSYAQSNAMKKQLWTIILRASEARKHTKKAQEARKIIQSL